MLVSGEGRGLLLLSGEGRGFSLEMGGEGRREMLGLGSSLVGASEVASS